MGLAGLIVAVLACVAGWLALPQVQQALSEEVSIPNPLDLIQLIEPSLEASRVSEGGPTPTPYVEVAGWGVACEVVLDGERLAALDEEGIFDACELSPDHARVAATSSIWSTARIFVEDVDGRNFYMIEIEADPSCDEYCVPRIRNLAWMDGHSLRVGIKDESSQNQPHYVANFFEVGPAGEYVFAPDETNQLRDVTRRR